MMRATNLQFLFLLCSCVLYAQSHLESGKALFERGRYTEAAAELRQDSSELARTYLALTQAAMNQCEVALPTLAKEAKRVDKESGRLAGLAAARCYAAAHETAQAVELLQQLQAQYPKDADVLYLLAETEMKAFNETTFQMFQRTPSSFRVHELSAEILELQSRYGDAIAEYQKAIAANPKAPDLHYRLGRALLLQGHSRAAMDEAARAFLAELAISPEDSASEFQLGQIAQVQGKSTDAEMHFDRALQFAPGFIHAMTALGKLYVSQKQYAKAIEILKQATTLQPSNETAHYALLSAYRDAGQREKAREEKATLDRLQKPPEGEFADFLKKLGEKPTEQ